MNSNSFPISSQHPSAASLSHALSRPPFTWRTVSLSAFSCPLSTSSLAPLEESSIFHSLTHKNKYASLKDRFLKDLKILRRRHEAESIREPLLLVSYAEKEAANFHTEFEKKLRWGKKDSPLLKDTQDWETDGEEDFDSRFESITRFFELYPNLPIRWAVADFYTRLHRRREEAENALEFMHLWEWSDRHWQFFRDASKLRSAYRRGKCDPPGAKVEWTPQAESRKRRYQYAVLNRVRMMFEMEGDVFPGINAPGGDSLEVYFGTWGRLQGWWPVDEEFSEREIGQMGQMGQMDGVGNVFDAAGEAAERVVLSLEDADSSGEDISGEDSSGEDSDLEESENESEVEQDEFGEHIKCGEMREEPSSDGSASTPVYGKGKSQQLELDGDADTVIPARDTATPTETMSSISESSRLYTANSSPSPTSTAWQTPSASGFFSDLRLRLAGKILPDAEPDPIPGWFSDWKNPRAAWPSGLKP
ncbi:hypothetical protein RUND412_009137 [Rhizina undulata]